MTSPLPEATEPVTKVVCKKSGKTIEHHLEKVLSAKHWDRKKERPTVTSVGKDDCQGNINRVFSVKRYRVMKRQRLGVTLKIVLIYLGIFTFGILIAVIFGDLILPRLPEPWQSKIPLWLGIAAATIAVLGAIAEASGFSIRYIFIPDDFIEKNQQISRERSLTNRRLMIERVQNIWIEGFLNNSIYGSAMIELGKQTQDDKISHPWKTILKAFDASPNINDADSKTMNMFRRTNRALLILGEPGSGKTTTLLELARDALEEAKTDPLAPIPVVFPLSTWSRNRSPISDWLLDELRTQYDVSRIIAETWIDNEDLLILLDGLDEVEEQHRESCIRELNNYRSRYGLTQIAICCRTRDYDALAVKLNLNGAIILQELSDDQISRYLEGIGSSILAVRRTLELDLELKELARSPLFLSVMLLAYKQVSLHELKLLDKNESRRNHIWRFYIQRMSEGKFCEPNFSAEQTKLWLGWLAHNMSLWSYGIFFENSMTDQWLLSPLQNFLYNLLTSICSCLIMGSLIGLAGGLVLEVVASPYHLFSYSFLFGSTIGLTYGAIMGIINGGIRLKYYYRERSTQRSAEEKQLREEKSHHSHSRLSLQELYENQQQSLLAPNYFWNIVRKTYMIWLMIWGISFILIRLNLLPQSFVFVWMIIGLGLAIFFLLANELNVIHHFILRIFLVYDKFIPWNYADFLSCATNRTYLRRLGSGYIFFHPFFLKYLSEQFVYHQ